MRSEKDSEPLISIALCTYNAAPYLREQMDSLLVQTHRRLEIVAVDDGSQDGTLELLQEYSRRDERVRVIRNPSNLGFRRNFHYAISLCTGDFIAPCDQDDVWLPEKLRVMVQALGVGSMVYCNSELIAADGRSLGVCMSQRWNMHSTRDPAAFVFTNCVSGHAMLFRRDMLAGVPSAPDVFFHDWWLATLAAARDGVVYCPQQLVRYRQHARNVTDVLKTRQEQERPAGHGWQRFETIRERIAALESLSPAHRDFFAEWLRLWERHADEWISWRLAAFALAHRERIFALQRNTTAQALSSTFECLFGVRLKRLLRPRKYRRP